MYKNFKIYNTGYTYILKADCERFGKQAIIFESYKPSECVQFMYNNYRNKDGKIIKNSRCTDRLYRKAMKTCKADWNAWYRGE